MFIYKLTFVSVLQKCCQKKPVIDDGSCPESFPSDPSESFASNPSRSHPSDSSESVISSDDIEESVSDAVSESLSLSFKAQACRTSKYGL